MLVGPLLAGGLPRLGHRRERRGNRGNPALLFGPVPLVALGFNLLRFARA